MLGLLPNPWLILGVLAGLAVAFIGGISTANKWNKVAELRAQVADLKTKQADSLEAQKRSAASEKVALSVIDSLETNGTDLEQELRDAQSRADAANAAAAKAIAALPAGSTPLSVPPSTITGTTTGSDCGLDPALIERMRNATPIGGKARVPARPR